MNLPKRTNTAGCGIRRRDFIHATGAAALAAGLGSDWRGTGSGPRRRGLERNFGARTQRSGQTFFICFPISDRLRITVTPGTGRSLRLTSMRSQVRASTSLMRFRESGRCRTVCI